MIFRLHMILFFAASQFVSLIAQEAWTDQSRILPNLLRQIPVALSIQHSPNPNYPEINNTGKNKDSKFVWKHSTTVCSPSLNLKVIKAGSFIWYDASGWKENVQFDKTAFSMKFNCKSGTLEKGSCYSFEKNYRWGSNLYGGDALWYVIAEDDDGNQYKGMAIIETESELLKN